MATRGPVCISVINLKGGVGKTTVAALLGRYASIRLRLDVLAIDLDPQANLSQALMGDRYKRFLADRSPSIVEVFKGHGPPSDERPGPSRLNLKNVVVGDTQLGGKRLKLIPSRFDFADKLMGATHDAGEGILADVIAKGFQEKDVIIIDCAPTESILTRIAYQASRYVLVPVRPEFFATIGFPLLRDSLADFKQHNRGHRIDVIGVVINNSSYHYSGNRGGPERRRSMNEIKEEASANGWRIFETQLPFSRGFPKMMRGDFGSPGDALQFRYFAEEFFKRLGIQADETT